MRQPTLTEAEWNLRYDRKDLIWKSEPSAALVEYAAHLASGRALDIAAGEGRNALWLAQQGWAVTAVDFSSVALEKARGFAADRGVADRMSFETVDVTTYMPETGGYDLVIMMYLHLPWHDMESAVTSATQAVRTGGTFILLAHDETNPMEGFGGPQRPDLLYGPEKIAQAIDDRLDILQAKRQKRQVGQRVAIDCLVVARR